MSGPGEDRRLSGSTVSAAASLNTWHDSDNMTTGSRYLCISCTASWDHTFYRHILALLARICPGWYDRFYSPSVNWPYREVNNGNWYTSLLISPPLQSTGRRNAMWALSVCLSVCLSLSLSLSLSLCLSLSLSVSLSLSLYAVVDHHICHVHCRFVGSPALPEGDLGRVMAKYTLFYLICWCSI